MWNSKYCEEGASVRVAENNQCGCFAVERRRSTVVREGGSRGEGRKVSPSLSSSHPAQPTSSLPPTPFPWLTPPLFPPRAPDPTNALPSVPPPSPSLSLYPPAPPPFHPSLTHPSPCPPLRYPPIPPLPYTFRCQAPPSASLELPSSLNTVSISIFPTASSLIQTLKRPWGHK